MRGREVCGLHRAALAALLLMLTGGRTGAQSALVAPAPGDTLQLSLQAATDRALSVGEEMRRAEADYTSAHAQYLQARADALPQLTFGTTYTRQFESIYNSGTTLDFPSFTPDTTATLEQRVRDLEKNLPTASLSGLAGLFNAGPFASENTWNATVGLTQKIIEGGSIWGAIRAADHALRSVDSRRQDRAIEVKLLTREAYLGALLADRGVRIAEIALDQATTQLERVRLRQQAGQTAEFDLLQAEVQRDNQLPLVKQARNAREVAYLQLRGLANLPVTMPLHLSSPLLEATALPSDPAAVDTTGFLAGALRASGIVALEEEVAARDHAITVAAKDRWPGLSLFANYSELAFPGEVFPKQRDWRKDVNAGLRLNWNAFDGFRTRGLIQASRADRALAAQNLAQGREAVNLVVAQNVGELQRAAAEIKARARTVELARRALDLANLRYEEGASSLLEVSDARLAWQLAQSNEARSRHDYFVALARLERYTERPLFTNVAQSVGGGR